MLSSKNEYKEKVTYSMFFTDLVCEQTKVGNKGKESEKKSLEFVSGDDTGPQPSASRTCTDIIYIIYI